MLVSTFMFSFLCVSGVIFSIQSSEGSAFGGVECYYLSLSRDLDTSKEGFSVVSNLLPGPSVSCPLSFLFSLPSPGRS